MTAPPPAAVRPGVGAPVVGQPGAPRPKYPRSPYHRVLPPTGEPTVFASEAPRAGWETTDGPAVLGIPLPVLAHDVPRDADRVFARMCANSIESGIVEMGLRDDVLRLSVAKRTCFMAHMYDKCMASIHSMLKRLSGDSDELSVASMLMLLSGDIRTGPIAAWKAAACATDLDDDESSWVDAAWHAGRQHLTPKDLQ